MPIMGSPSPGIETMSLIFGFIRSAPGTELHMSMERLASIITRFSARETPWAESALEK